MQSLMPYGILLGHVLTLIIVDLFVFNKSQEPKAFKSAIFESLFFVINALLFAGIVFWIYDQGISNNINQVSAQEAVIKYITGYLIELSLSIDNLFVIAVIFTSFKIPSKYQHNLLFYGILGAIIFRAVLIMFGLALIHKFEYMTIVFGLFLLYTSFKMLKDDDHNDDLKEPKGIMKYYTFSKDISEGKYVVIENNKKVFTYMMAALVSIEMADLLFALDSIPAIFAVTTDPFIVYSSNIFAIMGLRSMYFFLSDMLDRFSYLKYSIFAILFFVGLKLIAAKWIHFPEYISLLFIAFAFVAGIFYSLAQSKKETHTK